MYSDFWLEIETSAHMDAKNRQSDSDVNAQLAYIWSK